MGSGERSDIASRSSVQELKHDAQSGPIRSMNLAMWRPSQLHEARRSHAICIKL